MWVNETVACNRAWIAGHGQYPDHYNPEWIGIQDCNDLGIGGKACKSLTSARLSDERVLFEDPFFDGWV